MSRTTSRDHGSPNASSPKFTGQVDLPLARFMMASSVRTDDSPRPAPSTLHDHYEDRSELTEGPQGSGSSRSREMSANETQTASDGVARLRMQDPEVRTFAHLLVNVSLA